MRDFVEEDIGRKVDGGRRRRWERMRGVRRVGRNIAIDAMGVFGMLGLLVL